MPHNWASAECVRYLRHMLALEDGESLRLLNGITGEELIPAAHYSLQNSPTRFGRINLELQPAGAQGWRLRFDRASGISPSTVSLPANIGPLQVKEVIGAGSKKKGASVEVDPGAKKGRRFLSKPRTVRVSHSWENRDKQISMTPTCCSKLTSLMRGKGASCSHESYREPGAVGAMSDLWREGWGEV